MFQYVKTGIITLLMTAVLGCWGCASINQTERIPGVPRPAERMRSIRELGKNASKVPENQHDRYAQTLSKIIHEESDPLIRREAVLAIGGFHSTTTDEALRYAAKDADRDVREAVCTSWARREGKEPTAELIQILAVEMDVDIRLHIIDLLGARGDAMAVPALAAPLSENDPALQHYTVLALEKITGQQKASPVEWLAYCREQAEAGDSRISGLNNP